MKIVQYLCFILGMAGLWVIQPALASDNHQYPACTRTAQVLKNACQFDVKDNYLVQFAVCKNLAEKEDRRDCYTDARKAQRDERKLCSEVLQARKELCSSIGEARYVPAFGEDYAANFVNPLDIGSSVTPNPYFPLVQGNQWTYAGTFIDDEGEQVTETITVTVTNKTKLIQGITCLVVNDIVITGEDEIPLEDTDDWYAQDLDGNVWYCGEISENFELFEGDNPEAAELVDVDGSWKAGREGAKAGILIPAMPQVGDVIRQEVAWGDAEDVIEIIDTAGTESSPAAACFGNCLVTKDFTPLDPEVEENKYYAPGVGMIVEIDLQTGDRFELIEFNTP